MFKAVLIAIAVPALLILLTGCSVQDQNSSNQEEKIQVKGEKSTTPEDEADITGIVKSMIGNQITITQIDMEAIREQMMADRENTGDDEEEKKENSFVSGQPGGGMGPGMRGGGERPSLTDEQKEGIQAKMLENSLGDIKVIFPVGIPMYKTRNVEASLADVVIGSSVTVWLNDLVADRSVAEYVIIK